MTAVPYNQFTIPAEELTGDDGTATLVFRRDANFPASDQQQQLTLFIRATKPGEDPLAGVSTRRLVADRLRGLTPTPAHGRARAFSGAAVARRSFDGDARRGNPARERLARWGAGLSRSGREPAAGPACGRGVPPSTPLPKVGNEGTTLVPGEVLRHRARITTVGAGRGAG